MRSKFRLFSLFLGFLFIVAFSACTKLVKKEYKLVPQSKTEQNRLVSLLEKEQKEGAVHGFDFSDTTKTKLWIRFYPGQEESAEKIETYLLLKEFLDIDGVIEEEEEEPEVTDTSTDKTIKTFDSLYKRIQSNPSGEVLKKSELLEKVDSALEIIEREQADSLSDSLKDTLSQTKF